MDFKSSNSVANKRGLKEKKKCNNFETKLKNFSPETNKNNNNEREIY